MSSRVIGEKILDIRRKGFTLIEVVIAIQIAGIGLSMLLAVYMYLQDHMERYKEIESQLAYERSFLQVISRDITNAKSARMYQNDLYLRTADGLEYKYNFKELEKRLDKSTPTGGRITMGVALDSMQFSVEDAGVTIHYKIQGSSEKQRYFRFR